MNTKYCAFFLSFLGIKILDNDKRDIFSLVLRIISCIYPILKNLHTVCPKKHPSGIFRKDWIIFSKTAFEF